MNTHGGTTNDLVTIVSGSNLLSSRGTFTTSGRTPLIFRVNLTSKRKALGSAPISIQRISAGLSNGWKKNANTSRGNTGSRATRSLSIKQEEARDASRLAESRYRHRDRKSVV